MALNPLDTVFATLDEARRTLFCPATATRPTPQPSTPCDDDALSAEDKALSAALMRVNHVGEVCAQALYTAQAAVTEDPQLQAQLRRAAQEETDHLAWTEHRLRELGSRSSWLNPLWWGGAFAIGVAAARASDRLSLGFVVETERQVEAHLAGHLTRLPESDTASRAIVQQMKADEAAHADWAQAAGGQTLPAPVKWAMRCAAQVMTFTAHRV